MKTVWVVVKYERDAGDTTSCMVQFLSHVWQNYLAHILLLS